MAPPMVTGFMMTPEDPTELDEPACLRHRIERLRNLRRTISTIGQLMLDRGSRRAASTTLVVALIETPLFIPGAAAGMQELIVLSEAHSRHFQYIDLCH